MELTSHNSFHRDLDSISNRELHSAIGHLVKKIRHAHSISQIQGIKHLRTRVHAYKIELQVQSKVYWILCEVHGHKIIFIRIKSEAWCKNNL